MYLYVAHGSRRKARWESAKRDPSVDLLDAIENDEEHNMLRKRQAVRKLLRELNRFGPSHAVLSPSEESDVTVREKIGLYAETSGISLSLNRNIPKGSHPSQKRNLPFGLHIPYYCLIRKDRHSSSPGSVGSRRLGSCAAMVQKVLRAHILLRASAENRLVEAAHIWNLEDAGSVDLFSPQHRGLAQDLMHIFQVSKSTQSDRGPKEDSLVPGSLVCLNATLSDKVCTWVLSYKVCNLKSGWCDLASIKAHFVIVLGIDF
jgi:hypothetical protein